MDNEKQIDEKEYINEIISKQVNNPNSTLKAFIDKCKRSVEQIEELKKNE